MTWDDSEGDYDHVPPPVRAFVPGKDAIAEGPRVPLLVISPYAKNDAIDDESGDQGSVVKLVDELFGLQPLAELPDEIRASGLGARRGLGPEGLGPDDGFTSGTTNLLSAFDVARLDGKRPPLAASSAIVPDAILRVLPQRSGYGCTSIGIVPTDVKLGIPNPIPSDFNPRPKTNPSS